MEFSRKKLINRSALIFKDKPAVVCGQRSLSFQEVNHRANRLAAGLRKNGLRPGDCVATLMSNCLEYPEIEFGLVKGCFPQITLNPRLTPQEQLFQLDETGAKAVILQERYRDVIEPIRRDLDIKAFLCIGGGLDFGIEYEEYLSGSPEEEPEGELEPDEVGEIRYTSGTTGMPKGVMLPYRSRGAIMRNLLIDHLGGITSEDRFLALQPLYHGAGWFILPMWIRGVTQYIVPSYEASSAFDLIERERITIIKTVPTVLLRLLDAADLRSRDFRSVHTIIYGGSPMPVERLKEALEVFGPVFVNLYGQLEAAMTITWLSKEQHTANRLGSVGRPCTLVDVRVVHESGSDVAPGELGELIVHGDHQMLGYLNRPEATAETMRKGWIHTADLGTVDEEGFIYLSGGRKSEMIVTGGLNVYPAEVEQVLYQHPCVAQAGVIGVPDNRWGEAVKACVALKPGHSVSEEDLIVFCKERMAGYKSPKSIVFVDDLPLNASGKIAYSELRDRYRAS